MKDNVIFVNYDPFAMDSRVTIYGDNQEQMIVSSNIDELSGKLADIVNAYRIYNLRIHAPLALYTEITRSVREYAQNKYSINEITMEIV